MNEVRVISFQTKLPAFHFLGIENIVTENSDFGAFWGNFFDRGGYDKIEPYQLDPNCINVWYNKASGERVYFQGRIVGDCAEIPEGYTLAEFPESEYLVVTTEWLPTYEDTMKHIRHEYYENAEIPAGYRKRRDSETGVYLLERWGEETADGFRYEFWLPLEKI